MQCLNLNNKEVKAAVDEVAKVLGSENAAYYIISENNGYAIDQTPDGVQSDVFSDLLNKLNGDREKAIKEMAKTFAIKATSKIELEDVSKTDYVDLLDKLGKKIYVKEKLVKDIRKGIKQRLASIKRYQTKNLDVIRNEEKLLDDLNKLDSIEGITEFVNYVSSTISDAFKFLNERPDDINSRQLVQLKRDYLSFFMPMMQDIQYVTDTTDELKQYIEDYQDFKDTVDNIVTGQATLMNKYNNILRYNFRSLLEQYAIEHNSPTVEKMMNWIDDPEKDLSYLEYFIGQNSSTNNEIIRIMADMLSNQINVTKRATYDKGITIVDLYNKAKAANPKLNVMTSLQEKDSSGQTTGYFTRDRNYGQFYKDQKEAINKIVTDMGLVRDQEGVIQFESKEQEKEFRKRKTKWQLKHGELKYTEEYYKLKWDLPVEAQNALDEIDTLTNNILSKARQSGFMLLNKFTQKDLNNLDNLSRQRAELYSDYYADGTPKAGTYLVIAKSLQNFRKKLYDKVKYKTDYEKFNRTAKAVIDKYGINSDQYKKWFESATQESYTDEFFELLDKITGSKNEEIQELYDERARLLNMYRDKSTRQINIEVPQTVKDLIIDLDKRIAQARLSNRPTLGEGDIQFNDIAQIQKTKKYYEDAQVAKEEGRYEEWYAKNHYEVNGKLRTASYYTYMEPTSNKYKKIVPNAYFNIVDQDSEFVNSNYDLDGEYVQPKKSLYDNSTAFKVIQNNKELKELYDYLVDSMKESYSKISFVSYSNPYRLPQISGRMMSIISRSDDKFDAIKYIIKDEFTVKDDDAEYIKKEAYRNDGSRVKLIPTRYINMMDDPSKITSDVCGSVIQFSEMAENYKNMSEIQDDLEMIMYGLGDLKITTKRQLKQGTDSNVYKKAQELLDMALYGEKKKQITLGNINITKGVQKVYNYISLNNLANNIWAITANYVTGQANLDIESIADKYFNTDDIFFAKRELASRIADITANIGNVNHKDKLMMMMQRDQVTRSNSETFDRLDQSRTLRALNQHFWYNGYTAGDFMIKSQLLMATYHSYKYYKGEYLNKSQFIDKYYSNAIHDGERAFKALTDTLWDAYDVVDGKLTTVAEGDKNKAATKIQPLVQKKINTLAVRIDGNITDIDRAGIHRNVLTQFFVMHRNFMINGIQERFKAKQFNYSTGEMEGGMYADAVKFIYHAASKGKLNVISQALADWNELDELERYNIKKVMMDLANIIIWGSIISTLLVAAADDEPDNWALQAMAYSATRISFEFRTLYNPMELTGLFNSPSAAFSTFDNASNYLKLLWIPNFFGENNIFSEVKSGKYKGWPKILRNTLKLTPIKNIYEATSVEGIRGKRNYLENQLMF